MVSFSLHLKTFVNLKSNLTLFPRWSHNFLKSTVLCCCKLNNTQVCDEHLFQQISTHTGPNQLPIFRCTNAYLGRHTRSLIYAGRRRWGHESEWAHNSILPYVVPIIRPEHQLKMVVQNSRKVNREHARICSGGVLWTWLDQTEWSRDIPNK